MTRRTPLLIFGTLAFGMLVACSPDVWSAQELSDWHARNAEGSPHYSPLYYTGTDDDYHHFKCRAMDTWVVVRVPRDQITIPEVPASQDPGAVPRLYAVDPANDYRILEASAGQ